MPHTLLALALAVPLQEPAAEPPPEEPGAAETASAEELQERIHEMRMDLLLGGDRVRAAEAEAVDFYGNKRELVDQRLDAIGAELSEKRASYDVVLARALEEESAAGRRRALEEASGLRQEISSLESEAAELRDRRDGFRDMVAAVEARDRERRKLATELETRSTTASALAGIPLSGIGLAPAASDLVGGGPLENEALVRDLLERDPREARRVLYELDPAGYWGRFPLRPPAELLPSVLEFPLPDPPGLR